MRASALILALMAASPSGALAAEAEGPGAPASAPGARHMSLRFQGTLREAIERIAASGRLNVVAAGDLSEHVQVLLTDVSAEEALTSIAKAYHLKVEREGRLWTLQPLPAAGVPGAPAIPAPPLPPPPPTAQGQEVDTDDAEPPGEPDEDAHDAQERIAEKLKEKFGHPHPHPHPGAGTRDAVGTGLITVSEGQTVNDAVVYGGKLDVLGHVKGDAVAFGGSVHLGPKAVVDGDVATFGGSIEKDEGAEIGGDKVQIGGGGVWKLIGGGMKSGFIKPHPIVSTDDEIPAEEHRPRSLGSVLPTLLIEFALYFALGFLFVMFAPSRMKQVELELKRDPVKCVLAGLLGALALAFLTLLLTITIVGIPFALCLMLLVAVGVAMGFSAIAMEIGTRLPVLRGRKTQAAVLAMGVGILLLVRLIPVVGPTLTVLFGLFSLGAIIRTRLGSGGPKGFPEPV